MKKQQDIEQLANQTLESIDALQPVEANAFLFTRIQAKMHSRKLEYLATAKTLSRLSVALVLFIGLNCASYYYLLNNKPEEVHSKKLSAVEALESEYQLKPQGQYNY